MVVPPSRLPHKRLFPFRHAATVARRGRAGARRRLEAWLDGPAAPRCNPGRLPSTSGPGDAPATSLGFALQLCVLRYPGRLLTPGAFVPPAVVDFIGRQLDLDGGRTCRLRGAVRDQARASLPTCAGCTDSFSGPCGA